MDKITKEQRSRNMAAIRGKGNKTTEIAFSKLLRISKIKGWRRHLETISGKPDFVFSKERVAIFIDGCFWHGCARCRVNAKSNIKYWKTKITNNQSRDRRVNRKLIKEGWKVLRIWEHELVGASSKMPARIERNLRRYLKAQD